MRTVLINPATKKIDVVDLQSVRSATIKYFGEHPSPVLRLPRGDVMLAVKAARGDAFVFGGSRPVGGVGLIVGSKLRAGERAPARVDPFHVAQMVRWTSIEEDKTAEREPRIRAIEIDPERETVEEVLIAPTLLAVQHRLGGEININYQTPDGDVVIGHHAAIGSHAWRKDDAVFQGRCIVIGRDARRGFADAVTELSSLRKDVSFR